MSNWIHFLGMALAPLGLVCLIWLASVIKILIIKHMKNGWLKNQLLRQRWESASSNSHRRITREQDFR